MLTYNISQLQNAHIHYQKHTYKYNGFVQPNKSAYINYEPPDTSNKIFKRFQILKLKVYS